MMWDEWCGGASGQWWGLMGLAWILVIGLAVWLIGRMFPRERGVSDAGTILDARLAHGEISLEEYKKLRTELDKVTRL